MANYRKKPVIVEAEVYQKGMEDGFEIRNSFTGSLLAECGNEEDLENFARQVPIVWRPTIKTLEGYHVISPGDYIVTGIKGERYPCKPDVFEMTYELVE